MTLLDKHNVLDLIGKYKNRYHSCILTCFSFDFNFFEERVLPVLRLANIRNIIVLVDGKYYESLLEEPDVKAFRSNQVYSLNPIFVTGVFHPKIMFLAGKNDGLAILGSGNLTASGMVSNDEIWSAFHQNNLESINFPVFAPIWNYLMSFKDQLLGFNIQKIEWIRQYSTWIEELKHFTSNEFIPINDSTEIRLVANNSKLSIYTQLKKLLPQSPLKRMVIISPYYDTSGTFISNLHTDYAPEDCVIVVDEQFGLLPTNTPLFSNTNVTFVSWYECIKQEEKEYNRLHAKIIQLEYNDGEQYFIFGSPNATIRAFGSENKKAANAEAAFVLKNQGKDSFLSQLGIKIPVDKTINLAQYKNKSFVNPEFKTITSYNLVRVTHAEIYELSLTFFVNKILEEPLTLLLLNEFDEIIETHQIKNLQSINKVKVASTNVQKLYFVDKSQERISNFMVVYDISLQMKSNPDSKRAKLDEKLNAEFLNGDDLSELLKYVVSDWKEEEYSEKQTPANTLKSRDTPSHTKNYETLEEEDFNTINQLQLIRQSALLNKSSVRIIEFLNLMGKQLNLAKEEEITESSEQALIGEEEGEGQIIDSVISNKTTNLKEHKIQTEIEGFLKKMLKYYDKRLSKFFQHKNPNDIAKKPLSINDLSNFLIGLQLIKLYYGKTFTVQNGEQEKLVSFFSTGSFTFKKVSIFWFVNNIIGKFTLLANNGFEQYEYELTNEKCQIFQQDALEKMLFITLNLSWSKNRLPYLEISLLNILNTFRQNLDYKNDFIKRLKIALEKQVLVANYIDAQYPENHQFFFSNVLPTYLEWLIKYNDLEVKKGLVRPIEHLPTGTIIFNSKLGFSKLHKKRFIHSNRYQLSLIRTGFPIIEHVNNRKDYMLKQVLFSSKTVLFK